MAAASAAAPASKSRRVNIPFTPLPALSMNCTCETTLSPAAKAPLVPTLADRRLECEARIPREIDPGVLRHLGDEGVDQWPAHGLCVDRSKMGLRQHVAHHARGFAGVDQVVDNKNALPLRLQFRHLR